MNNTNFWDVLVILAYFSFLLAGLSGTVYLITVYGWSKWWMLAAIIVFGSVHVKTGYGPKSVCDCKKEETK